MSWTTHRWNNGETSIRWNPDGGWPFPSEVDIVEGVAESHVETGVRPTMIDITGISGGTVYGMEILTELVEFS